jgi:hypothetical protein
MQTKVGAFVSILLLAAWMAPAPGRSCPSEGHDSPAHAHADAGQVATASHAHADHEHGHAGEESAVGDSNPTRDSSSHEPTCCGRGADLPAIKAGLTEAQPRPKAYAPVLPTLPASAVLPGVSATGIDARHHRSPPPPFAHTRRPLLI